MCSLQLRGVAGVTIEDDGALDDEEPVEPVVSDDDEDGFQEEEALEEESEDEDDDADMQELQVMPSLCTCTNLLLLGLEPTALKV